ncbi:hypothetical protein PVAP13_9KG651300 [Panicum virgatum]|uniref:Uncharacterized protein n=1 Tax=Panicum virgatum TaxID=38727 RepID=A0A8T0NXE2_PANVG|nr:hypothetical protein PVAP13_9KG651300 [Panicum virgatum]
MLVLLVYFDLSPFSLFRFIPTYSLKKHARTGAMPRHRTTIIRQRGLGLIGMDRGRCINMGIRSRPSLSTLMLGARTWQAPCGPSLSWPYPAWSAAEEFWPRVPSCDRQTDVTDRILENQCTNRRALFC